MSYINQPSIKIADGPNADAFQRLRVGEPLTIFDSKQLYYDNTFIWSTLITGNATSSFIPYNASMALSASATNSSIVRQTKKRHIYQPGKSQLAICTGNFNQLPTASVIKRIGYFDQNNGIGWASSGSSFGIFYRTNTSGTPVDTFISQSSWNVDTYNGLGPSGNTLNITSSQIYFTDFEWLGVGRVRWGIYQGGIPTYVHQLTNINALNTVYMSSPNQPIRYEIVNSGSAGSTQTLTHICSTVVSEGGLQNFGSIKAASSSPIGGAGLAYAAGAYYGTIALRLSASCLDSGIIPLAVCSSQTSAATSYEITLLINPSGSLPWVWQNLPNSPIQFATASGLTYTIANEGMKIYSSMVGAQFSAADIPYDAEFALGSDVTGSQDVLVVGWKGISGASAGGATSITWREI